MNAIRKVAYDYYYETARESYAVDRVTRVAELTAILEGEDKVAAHKLILEIRAILEVAKIQFGTNYTTDTDEGNYRDNVELAYYVNAVELFGK